MPTSGSSNFSQTRNEVIMDALSLIGVNSIGKTPEAETVSLANRLLNKMVKAWSAKGLHLWSKEEGILFLEPYQGQYSLGSSNVNFATVEDSTTTVLSSAGTTADTTLQLHSSTGIVIGDRIGIVRNGGVIYWTTVSTIPNSTSVTIPGPGLPENINKSNLVFTYTTRAGKPLRILNARSIMGVDLGADGSSQAETQFTIDPYQSYFEIGKTTATGNLPNQGMYNPRLNDGVLYVWPIPINASVRLQLTYERQIEDLDNINDEFDFPNEWLEALTYQLAVRMGTPLGKEAKAGQLLPIASLMLKELLDWDTEITSIKFEPYFEGDY